MKTMAAKVMTLIRPIRSAMRPATHAPIAQPIRAIETVKPVTAGEVLYWAVMPGIAPLITEESNPKRNPPRAATEATVITRRLPDVPVLAAEDAGFCCGLGEEAELMGRSWTSLGIDARVLAGIRGVN